MRNTVQRVMILETVRSMTNHPTADEIYEKVGERCPGISKGTVYRDLNRLAQDGEILRVPVANAPDRYDLTVESHAHCLCCACGRVFDYKLKEMPRIDNEMNELFIARSIDIIVNGICKECGRNVHG